MLSDPGRTRDASPLTAFWCCPRWSDGEDSRDTIYFEAQSHGLSTGCLRFVPSSQTTTQNSLPEVANPYRVGLDTHRVPLSSFRFSLPLLLGCFMARRTRRLAGVGAGGGDPPGDPISHPL